MGLLEARQPNQTFREPQEGKTYEVRLWGSRDWLLPEMILNLCG